MNPLIFNADVCKRSPRVDLIVSCCDLPSDDLESVMSLYSAPPAYVPVNHDQHPLQLPGGRDLDSSTVEQRGLRIMGLRSRRTINVDPNTLEPHEVDR